MNIGPSGSRVRSDAAQVARARGWVFEVFGLGEEEAVTVMELRCSEPGCPPIETSIGILRPSAKTEQHKFHKPLADLTREDVEGLVDGARSG